MSVQFSAGDGSMPKWFKSSHSSNDGPACVEVAAVRGAVRVRDSKDRQGPILAFSAEQWSAFVSFVAFAASRAV